MQILLGNMEDLIEIQVIQGKAVPGHSARSVFGNRELDGRGARAE